MLNSSISSFGLSPPPPALPRWNPQGFESQDTETLLFSTAAALAALDRAARSPAPVATLWRRRLALSAAVAVAALDGRREGEPQLWDALVLCRAGDDPGPAARCFLAGAPYTYVTAPGFLPHFRLETLRDPPDLEALTDAVLLAPRPGLELPAAGEGPD